MRTYHVVEIKTAAGSGQKRIQTREMLYITLPCPYANFVSKFSPPKPMQAMAETAAPQTGNKQVVLNTPR